MTVTRSALFAASLVAGFACLARSENPAPPAAQTTSAVPVYEPSVPASPGTAAPWGAGALGGAAIATQPLPPQDIADSEPAPATERQARPAIAPRRTTTRPTEESIDTRANHDSQDQSVGGGDTYDRNR